MKSLKRSSYSFYSPVHDEFRLAEEPPSVELAAEPYRSSFRKDYGRLVHSASLRRLTGKTQLYPGTESDFFRNRLSHSLEVAQIAKSIAIKLNSTKKFPSGKLLDLDTDLIEFAALAHDIGHPPFGHQGEKALDECMLDHGGFEGNAQTLRILCKNEKKFLVDPISAEYGINKAGKDIRVGLNLCMRSLASIIKYDKNIPLMQDQRLQHDNLKKDEVHKIRVFKGYYACENDLVKVIKKNVLREVKYRGQFKTIECDIMELADDIAYSTYDLEDGLKAGFYHPLDIIFSRQTLLRNISTSLSRKLDQTVTENEIRDVFVEIFDRWLFQEDFNNQYKEIAAEASPLSAFLALGNTVYKTSKEISKSGYSRVQLTSFLVGKFIRGIEFDFNRNHPMLSKVFFNDETRLIVEVLKTFNYESMILSPRLKIAEFRGKEIVKKIFDTLIDKKTKGYLLMPRDYQELFHAIEEDQKPRIICDYIAGMTDRYCIEFYGRLISENPETIFKPF